MEYDGVKDASVVLDDAIGLDDAVRDAHTLAHDRAWANVHIRANLMRNR